SREATIAGRMVTARGVVAPPRSGWAGRGWEAVRGGGAVRGSEIKTATPGFRRRAEFLGFSPPTVGESEIEEVADAMRSGWLSTGPRVKEFEEAFAARVGAPAAVALNSCTAGLHTALIALGIGPGDEVITTPMTFASSVNVIEHVGATPTLADVEPDTLNLAPPAVDAAVTPRTRAILAVHYAGHPAELDALRAIAEQRRLALIEDAAHALPARYKGRQIGSGDNPVAFSFYATKNLTTGEGGMLTAAPDVVARARVTSLHGMSRDAWRRYAQGGTWFYEVLEPGFKYNMTDLQAAMGLVQLRRLDAFQQRRRTVVAAYNAGFGDEPALRLPVERPEVEHAWHLYVLRLEPAALRIGRDQFIAELAARNIGTSVHFIPVHLHPFYRRKYGFQPDAYPVALANYECLITLPLHPGLSDRDVADVIDAVRDVARTYRR
ncbi:MAG TPA: DegT/DnrJ/EryC1/StrS family aminotransferase, partial [Gemmatimonadales bacterium]|nr:DegT/DnrJ/EryC1/StrS family aminotransferase [Gemmatimonadales bacterium]